MPSVIPFPTVSRKTPRVYKDNTQGGPAPAAMVKEELAKIAHSAGFVNAPRMRRFLTFIVEETLAGRAAELCEYSIAMSVFERKAAFEPGLDPIVRNDARRLRAKLMEYYGHAQDWQPRTVRIEVPKGGYVPVFRVCSGAATVAPEWRSGLYRLKVIVTRTTDGAEMLSRTYEIGRCGCSVQVEF